MEPVLFPKSAQATSLLIALVLPAFTQNQLVESRNLTEVGPPQTFVQRQESPRATENAPETLTLRDALTLAEKNDPAFLSAQTDAAVASEDLAQAKTAILPNFSGRSEYLGTEGNGKTPTGRFVTNDGVHVYRDWLVMHQDLSPGTFMRTGVKRADAALAIARARAEVARRGLAATVTKAYYALVVAQRKYATAQEALNQSQHSLEISENLERGREVAHSDVVKFQLTYATSNQAFRESKFAMESARLDLAVLLFRDFNESFSIVDDLDVAPALPPMADIEAMAGRQNPILAQAMESLRATELDISLARQAFLPSVSLDPVYGIEANAVALNSAAASFKELGPLPNLGYFITASVNMPLWDWGVRRSKLKQAELRREQANLDLSTTQRTLVKNLHAYFEEAQAARDEVNLLRQAVDLASESLRLNALRYQGGEATVLDLVDAQTTLIQARNAYDDGLVRYRVSLGNLQTLTGAF
jgi:outer membrane protein TolC